MWLIEIELSAKYSDVRLCTNILSDFYRCSFQSTAEPTSIKLVQSSAVAQMWMPSLSVVVWSGPCVAVSWQTSPPRSVASMSTLLMFFESPKWYDYNLSILAMTMCKLVLVVSEYNCMITGLMVFRTPQALNLNVKCKTVTQLCSNNTICIRKLRWLD